jgi:predicted Holliday junction resolvase-like endonuclease
METGSVMNAPAAITAADLVMILGGLLAVAVFLLVWLGRSYYRLLRDQANLVKEATRKSVNQSRNTLKGQLAEQMAPLLPGFPYQPADARFLGDPLDYLVFDGLAGRGDDPELELEIVLLEIKQGQSRLTPVQRAIGRAVEAGRVRFEVSRVTEDGEVATETWRAGRH